MSSESQISRQSFSQKFRELAQLMAPYESSYRCALLYYVQLKNAVVQMCCVFQPNDVDFMYQEVYSEPRASLKIYAHRMDVTEILKYFKESIDSGEIRVIESLGKFVSPVTELVHTQIFNRETIQFMGKEWSCRGLRVYTSKTLEKILNDFDFNGLSRILWEEKSISSLGQLVSRLNLPDQLAISSSQSPGVCFLLPVYARIRRCNVVRDKVKVFIEIAKGFKKTKAIYLNIIKSRSGLLPSSLKVFPADMTLLGKEENGMCCLTYEVQLDSAEHIDISLKDDEGVLRSSERMNIEWINRYQQCIKSFHRDAMLTRLKKSRDWGFPVALTLVGLCFVYITSQYATVGKFPDPVSAATLVMALATFLLAWMSKKGLDMSRSQQLKGLAEESINKFLIPLKGTIQTAVRDTKDDKTLGMPPDRFVPEPHLRVLTFEENPMLPKQLSLFLSAVLNYNSSIEDKDSEELRRRSRKVIDVTDEIISKLGKRYGISPEPPENY